MPRHPRHPHHPHHPHRHPRHSLASLALSLAAATGLAFAVASHPAEPTAPTPQPLPAEPKVSDAKTLAADNARFAFDLYRQLSKTHGNLFFSPHSISTALAMTSAGAGGTTAAELTTVLRWSQSGDLLHDSFAALARRLTPPAADHPSKTYQWTQASRMWLGTTTLPSFNDRLKLSYAADAGALDADPATSADRINAWTDANTNHRIARLVEAADLADVQLVITNAVFFKGSWKDPFSKDATAPRDFRTGSSATPSMIQSSAAFKTPTMAAVRSLMYATGDGFAAVSIPYSGGVSCTILLPDDGKQAAVEASLSADSFAATQAAMKGTLVDLTLPRFKFQSRQSLRKPLTDLGLTEAFSDGATFTRLTAPTRLPLKMADVIHVADVELDEKGTEAAAATAVTLPPARSVAPREDPPKPVIFHADHPFLVIIRHDATGEILFLGRVSDPR